MNKKVKKRLPETLSKSEVGALIEHFDSKLDLVAEGHGALDKKIEHLREDMDAGFKKVDYKFEIVFQKFGEVDKRFGQVDKRFDEVNQRFDEVKDELRLIRNELKEKVGRDEFLVLEKRVAALERASRRQ